MTRQHRTARRARLIATVIVATALAGCAPRESRVEAALVQAGVSPGMAACLAPRLAGRLSDEQLKALAQAARAAPGGAGAGGIVAAVAGTGDPQIIDVVARAGLHCALRG